MGGFAPRVFAQATGDDKRSRIDVDSYTIDAQINPDTQTLTARAAVRFIPLDEQTTSVTLSLTIISTFRRSSTTKGSQSTADATSRKIRSGLPSRRLSPKVSRGHYVSL